MLDRAMAKASEAGFLRLFSEESSRLQTLVRALPALQAPGAWNQDLRTLLGDYRPAEPDDQPGPAGPSARTTANPALLPEPLSQREMEVLALIHDGHANKDIATRMAVAPATVKAHIRNLYGKLGVGRRTEALARARELGLLSR